MTTMLARYTPDYVIKINGSTVPASLRGAITSVRYQDGHQAADRVEIAIANPDLMWLHQHIRGLGFSAVPTAVKLGPVAIPGTPAGLFDLDNSLDLSLGYAGSELTDVFTGDVTGLSM